MSTFIITFAEGQLMFILLGSLAVVLRTFDGSDFAFNVFQNYVIFVLVSFSFYLWGDHLANEWQYQEMFCDEKA